MAQSDPPSPPSTERPTGSEVPTPIPLAVHVPRRAPVRDDCERVLLCKICKNPVQMLSATTAHPEAPEMLRLLTPEAWLGTVGSIVTTETYLGVEETRMQHVDLVVVCSHKCLDELLSE